MGDSESPVGLNRRSALRGAAGLAGAAWLVPVITVVSMDAASAASGAPPAEGDAQAGAAPAGEEGQAPTDLSGQDTSFLTPDSDVDASTVGTVVLAGGAMLGLAANSAVRAIRASRPTAEPPAS